MTLMSAIEKAAAIEADERAMDQQRDLDQQRDRLASAAMRAVASTILGWGELEDNRREMMSVSDTTSARDYLALWQGGVLPAVTVELDVEHRARSRVLVEVDELTFVVTAGRTDDPWRWENPVVNLGRWCPRCGEIVALTRARLGLHTALGAMTTHQGDLPEHTMLETIKGEQPRRCDGDKDWPAPAPLERRPDRLTIIDNLDTEAADGWGVLRWIGPARGGGVWVLLTDVRPGIVDPDAEPF